MEHCLTIAKNNEFPLHVIHNLKKDLITEKTTNKNHTNTPKEKIDYIHLAQSTYTQTN